MNLHSGECPFCKSSVPTNAIICTGCGAAWGLRLKDGRMTTTEAFKRQKRGDMMSTLAMLPITALCYVISMLGDTGGLWHSIWLGISMFTGFFGLLCLLVAIKSPSQIKRAEDGWYRKV